MSLRFGVYGTDYSEEVLKSVGRLNHHPLVDRVMYHQDLAEKIGIKGYTLKDIQKANLDFMMTVGGDGTILRILRKGDFKILGMNTGRVGFLTAVDLPELETVLERMDKGEFHIDERIKLKTVLNGNDIGESTNEVVVHTDRVAKIRSFEVYLDGSLVDRFRADGVIVSTPTGSTCYSMSVGGPILDPRVPAFVIVPISPYKLATKPYIVPINMDINIKLVEKDKSCLMVSDGQDEHNITDKDEIIFRLAENTAKFVRFENDFYSRIQKKLVWR